MLQPWTFFLTGSLVLTGSYKLAGLKADRSQGKWQVYRDYFKKNLVLEKSHFILPVIISAQHVS